MDSELGRKPGERRGGVIFWVPDFASCWEGFQRKPSWHFRPCFLFFIFILFLASHLTLGLQQMLNGFFFWRFLFLRLWDINSWWQVDFYLLLRPTYIREPGFWRKHLWFPLSISGRCYFHLIWISILISRSWATGYNLKAGWEWLCWDFLYLSGFEYPTVFPKRVRLRWGGVVLDLEWHG